MWTKKYMPQVNIDFRLLYKNTWSTPYHMNVSANVIMLVGLLVYIAFLCMRVLDRMEPSSRLYSHTI